DDLEVLPPVPSLVGGAATGHPAANDQDVRVEGLDVHAGRFAPWVSAGRAFPARARAPRSSSPSPLKSSEVKLGSERSGPCGTRMESQGVVRNPKSKLFVVTWSRYLISHLIRFVFSSRTTDISDRRGEMSA